MRVLFILSFLGMSFVQSHAVPNIILIESDDQSNVAVGAFGFGTIKTPNIDRLADEGVYFTKAYNMGCWSPAVCIPSRTMLFNGTHLWEASKITRNKMPGPNLVERLNAAGYETYFTGKWHAMGKGPKETFDHVGQVLPGQLKTFWTENGHITDIVSQEAVDYIQEASKKEKPFFLYVAFNAPHVPRETEQKYYDLYHPDTIELPPSVKNGPLHPHIKYNYTTAPMKRSTMKTRYQQNNAMVTHMDDRIGDILNELKRTGAYDDSIIIFMSDQGINFGENGVAGKVCLYDVSVTAPLIITGPSIPKNLKIDERIYLQDLYPTLLELIGEEIPDYMDFKSLVRKINNPSSAQLYDSIYMAMFTDQRGIISDDYKLILYPEAGAAELYNLATDPWEMDDLSENPNYLPQIRSLCNQLLEWQRTTGDELNLRLIYPGFLK